MEIKIKVKNEIICQNGKEVVGEGGKETNWKARKKTPEKSQETWGHLTNRRKKSIYDICQLNKG